MSDTTGQAWAGLDSVRSTLSTAASFVLKHSSWTLGDSISTHVVDDTSFGLPTNAVVDVAHLGVARPSTISRPSLTPDLTARPMSNAREAPGSDMCEVAADASRGVFDVTGDHQAAHNSLQQHARDVQLSLIEPGETGLEGLQGPLLAAPGQPVQPEDLAPPYLEDAKKNWVKCDHCPKQMRLPCEMKYVTSPWTGKR